MMQFSSCEQRRLKSDCGDAHTDLCLRWAHISEGMFSHIETIFFFFFFFLTGCNAGPPVFMAALSADLLHCTKHQPVIFDAVKVNRGSGYNNKHGIFQAPVAGIYAFSATLSVEPNNAFHVAIVRGNATNEIGYLYADPQNIWLQRSTTIFTHLDQNEEVWMVCLSDSRIEGDHQHGWEGANDFHSHMSGFLVSADGNSSLYQLN